MNTLRFFIGASLGAALLLTVSSLPAEEPSTADSIAALKSADEAARVAAIDRLGALGDKAAEAVAPLEALLKDESATVRAHAAQALGGIGKPSLSAVPSLVASLKDEDAVVRRQAIKAVLAIHPGPKVTIPLAVKLLEDPDPGVRLRILNAVTEAGPPAVPGLIEGLKNEKAAYWACVILRDMGPAAKAAVPALVESLKNELPEIRREAVLALAAMEADGAPAVEPIAALLKDEQLAVPATYALARIGKIPPATEAVIRKNVSSKDAMLSSTSLWALAYVHPKDVAMRRDVTRRLMARLKDEDPFVRVQAAKALAALPPAPDITIPLWEEALKDADETTVRHALDALARLGAPAVPRLIAALEHEKIRLEVVYILSQIGADAAPATEALAKLLDDPSERVSHEAALALASIGPGAKAAIPALAAHLASGKDENAAALAYALGKIDPAEASAREALTGSLKSENAPAALAAAWALAQIKPASAETADQLIPVLTAGLKSEMTIARAGAAEALGQLGPLAKSASDALEPLLKDEDPAVREAATKALAAVRG